MTAEASIQSTPKPVSDPNETFNPVERTRETAPPPSSDVSLNTSSPQQSLELIKQMNAAQALQGVPDAFGYLTLVNPSAQFENNRQAFRRQESGREVPANRENPYMRINNPDGGYTERTRIRGVGAKTDTEVRLNFGPDGDLKSFRDHLGEWTRSKDGKSWTTGGPNFRVLNGSVSMDKAGNYTIQNNDYGVKSTHMPDGSVKREMTTSKGENLSVARNNEGVPVAFSDTSGNWTGDGKNWVNKETGEKRVGKVTLAEHGSFRFRPEKGESIEHQSPQQERIQKLKDELSAQYKVQFPKPGERYVDSENNVHMNGSPTEAELKTLREVLERTSHENYSGVKMWFIRPDENRSEDHAFYENDGKGKPHACAAGCGHENGIVRSKNGDMAILPKARQETKGFDGFEGALYHELGHHEQGEMFGHTSDWKGPKDTKPSRDLRDKLGWVYSKEHDTNLLKDKTGGLWRYDSDADKWFHSGGKKQPGDDKPLSSKQMRERALVRPATDYFNAPEEQHAEGLAMFRMGISSARDNRGRENLAIESPDLYKVIKSYDQAAINRKYFVQPGQEPRFIRDIDGKVVQNTPATRSRIEAQEREWMAKPK